MRNFRPFLLLFLTGSLSMASFLTWHLRAQDEADQAGWRVGFASTDITPEKPVFLAGYASRDRAHEGVAAPIQAKAMALTDAKGHRAVLVTTDLIGLTAEVAEPICRRIIEATGLERADILLNSSHTHAGPALSLSPDPTTKMDADQAAQQVAYTHRVQDAIVELAGEALEKCDQSARLSQATGIAPFVMNRREMTEERGIILGVNPRGPVDRSVPILRVTNPEGKLLGLVFQAACHNTTLGGNFYRITGDFAGYAQTMIEEKHPEAMALFMIGCAGDANPHPRGELSMSEQHGKTLGDEVCRLLAEPKIFRPIAGPLKTAFAKVDLPLQPAPKGKALAEFKLKSGGWRGFVASEIQKRRDLGEPIPESYRAPFSVWQFGQDLTLVGLSGEVVVDYVYLLEPVFEGKNMWISAYCHDVYGYLPSARILREGGYETRGIYAGGIGFFAPEVQEVVVNAIHELAKKAGRMLPEK